MVIHPPFLYLGYVGMTIPFGLASRGAAHGPARPRLPPPAAHVADAAVDLPDRGDRARRLVGLRGARLGRLLGLGPGGERVVPAVAHRDGGAALARSSRAQGRPQGLDGHARARHVPAHDPRHVHDALRRLQLGPLVHAERDRADDPRLPGRWRSSGRSRCSRCASTGSRRTGRSSPCCRATRCSWSTTCCSCCSPSPCCSAPCSRCSSRRCAACR